MGGGASGAKKAMLKSVFEVGLDGVTIIAGKGDFSEEGKGEVGTRIGARDARGAMIERKKECKVS